MKNNLKFFTENGFIPRDLPTDSCIFCALVRPEDDTPGKIGGSGLIFSKIFFTSYDDFCENLDELKTVCDSLHCELYVCTSPVNTYKFLSAQSAAVLAVGSEPSFLSCKDFNNTCAVVYFEDNGDGAAFIYHGDDGDVDLRTIEEPFLIESEIYKIAISRYGKSLFFNSTVPMQVYRDNAEKDGNDEGEAALPLCVLKNMPSGHIEMTEMKISTMVLPNPYCLAYSGMDCR